MDVSFRRDALTNDDEAREALRSMLQGQRTLEDVLYWGLAQRPIAGVSEVVIQDEFTHDVVVRHARYDVWLVYDCT